MWNAHKIICSSIQQIWKLKFWIILCANFSSSDFKFIANTNGLAFFIISIYASKLLSINKEWGSFLSNTLNHYFPIYWRVSVTVGNTNCLFGLLIYCGYPRYDRSCMLLSYLPRKFRQGEKLVIFFSDSPIHITYILLWLKVFFIFLFIQAKYFKAQEVVYATQSLWSSYETNNNNLLVDAICHRANRP